MTAVDAADTLPIPRLMARAAARFPDRPALVCDGSRVTWQAFDARCRRVANALISLGIGRGDRVCILSRNSIPMVEVYAGTLYAGACAALLPTMASPDALARMAADAAPKALFVDGGLADLGQPLAAGLRTLAPGGCVAVGFEAPGWVAYETLLAHAAETDPAVVADPADPFNIIYSSGTTGIPKGIVHDHAMRSFQLGRMAAFEVDETSVVALSTPLYSNTTLVGLIPALATGACTVIMPKFDVAGFLDLCQRERVTHTMLVPVQYQRIMAHPDFDAYDLSSMRVKWSTSAPLRAAVKRDIVARFPGKMIEIYGLTEGGPVAVLSATEFPDKLESVGRAGEGVELKVIDDDGNELPQGAVGEVVGRSGGMMAGYHNRPDLTAEVHWRDRDGRLFYRSGDMGRFDEDGFLYLSDRKKDVIISGGLNIYADDLERVLLAVDGVVDAAVIGVPSDAWGETPLGLVVLAEGGGGDAGAILAAANARLGKSQRLSAVEVRDSLPRSPIGKILKRDLRAPYWRDQS
ncbi:MAG: acyl--CoA ligase [Hyphomicrobiales bacterium]|nr:acyl--CoA ligase [Hyphomicrobiales bacterium]MCP5373583.1 acyl--CoA ligase [Hyphomicrobiales bacterium]